MRPTIYPKTVHQINKTLIDETALLTIEKLRNAGHTSYIVGGGVRDLLLGGRPKDFDISTSAHPEEIKKIFGRQCLLIGRRFRLAHIRHGSQIFEVATFRSGENDEANLITRDNIYGTEEEDVLRRDFTVNALFYDPENETVLDYIGGFEDVQRNLLKTIGDPDIRFQQDPVRMIRLLKFQARFGFRAEEGTLNALKRRKNDIIKCSPARVMEEIFKMLESGKADPFFRILTEYGFTKLLLPCFHHFFSEETKEKASAYLRTVDEVHSIPTREKIPRPVLLSALIFPILNEEISRLSHDRQHILSKKEADHLADKLLHAIDISSFVHFPKKLLGTTYTTIINQFRLTPLGSTPKYHSRIGPKEDFENALSLLRIRSIIDPSLGSTCSAWEELFLKQE